VDTDIVDSQHVAGTEIEHDVAVGLVREIAEVMAVEECGIETEAVRRYAEVGDPVLVVADGEDEGIAAAAAGEIVRSAAA